MPFHDSYSLLENASALRARAARDGYLFFRGLLPATEVLELRAQILELCTAHGLFDKHLVDDAGRVDQARMGAYYAAAYRLRALHALPRHAAIIQVYERLFGRPAIAHARTVLRTVPYGTNQVWPVHQDLLNIATHAEAWNTWLPVGDNPQALGTLSILVGSNHFGLAKARYAAANGLIVEEPPAGLQWETDDLACGDVVMFNALTFHRGEPNRLEGRLRLSIDACIQPADTPFVRGAFEPHRGDYGNFNRELGWDEVYADWPPNDPLRYYWKDLPIKVVDPLVGTVAQAASAH